MHVRALSLALLCAACATPEQNPAPQARPAQPAAPQPAAPEPAVPELVVDPGPPPEWLSKHELQSNAGTYVLRIDPPPSAMPDNESFRIDVWIALASDAGKLADGVSLAVDAVMPEHGHGMNRVPKISRADDGHFVVEGMYLHMTGRWELYLDVTRGAVTERAQCDVVLSDE